MKDLSIYFQEVNVQDKFEKGTIGSSIKIHRKKNFPEIDQKGIAIIMVPEYRNNATIASEEFRTNFRLQLYSLYIGIDWNHTLYDLGDILPGEKIEDTYFAINSVCQELIKQEVIPFIIGGTQDLTISMYQAYENLEQIVNLTTIDQRLDFGAETEQITYQNWLNKVMMHSPNYLFNYSNLGTQAHFVAKSTFDLLNELYFDTCRLGELNTNIHFAEPYLRNTDILSFDLESIRSSEFQSQYYTSPNGLYANEACRLMRYAGISDKLSSVGIFNYYSNESLLTDKLIAQLVWYFNEGYSHRKGDFPIGSKKNYIKYRVFLEELDEEIIFYKSDKSGRWWMEVPYPGKTNSKFIRHQMVPCSYETYLNTQQGEIPDLWWKTYQKLT